MRSYYQECEHCGRYYEATRIDSKFCSPSCRTMSSRKNKILREQKRIEERDAYWGKMYTLAYMNRQSQSYAEATACLKRGEGLDKALKVQEEIMKQPVENFFPTDFPQP